MIQSQNGHKRAVLYVRVSTEDQADNYSIPSQLEACRQYAESNGFSVAASFSEDYTGAVPIEKRPVGCKAYAMLKSGEADALIVYTMDRLVRPADDGDEWDTPNLVRSLAKLGREIHTADKGKLETTFTGLLIAMLDSKSAGDERRKIIERTSRGRYLKARDHKVVGGGWTPYGYTYSDGAFTICEAEARIVESIFKWYTVGDGESGAMGSKVIAQRLSSTGVITPGELRGRRRKKDTGVWDASTICRILESETYVGVWRYGKTIGKRGANGKRDEKDQVKVSVPAIIPRSVWEAAQAQRKYNVRMAKRNNTKREYLLRGMVRCGCEKAMIGHTPRPGYSIYRCASRDHRVNGTEDRSCFERAVRIEALESRAWEYAMEIITDPKKLYKRLKQAQADELAAMQPKREELVTVEALIAEVEAEADSIARAMKKTGGIVAKRLEHDAEQVNQRHTNLTKRRDRLQAEIDQAVITDESIADIVKFSRDAEIGLNDPTFADKRRWLEYLRITAEVKDGKGTVSTMLPVKPRTFDLQTLGSSR